jgi:hypothetical protein
MKPTAFGYSRKTVNEHGLHELSEVTVVATPSELRRIAAFLCSSADEMEKLGPKFGHNHLQDERDLKRNWDDSAIDVIVTPRNSSKTA